jgi:hypothetical protein
MADKLNVCSLLNSEFNIFNDLMVEFDWKLNESYIDRVVYVKSGNELDTFDIKLNSNTVYKNEVWCKADRRSFRRVEILLCGLRCSKKATKERDGQKWYFYRGR